MTDFLTTLREFLESDELDEDDRRALKVIRYVPQDYIDHPYIRKLPDNIARERKEYIESYIKNNLYYVLYPCVGNKRYIVRFEDPTDTGYVYKIIEKVDNSEIDKSKIIEDFKNNKFEITQDQYDEIAGRKKKPQ